MPFFVQRVVFKFNDLKENFTNHGQFLKSTSHSNIPLESRKALLSSTTCELLENLLRRLCKESISLLILRSFSNNQLGFHYSTWNHVCINQESNRRIKQMSHLCYDLELVQDLFRFRSYFWFFSLWHPSRPQWTRPPVWESRAAKQQAPQDFKGQLHRMRFC